MSAIKLVGVSREFKQGSETIMALAPTDLLVESGEFVGVIGPSGSGKSTLLTIMGGLRTPSTGQVEINGQAFSELPEKGRARIRLHSMGFILQASSLIPFLKLDDQFTLSDKVTGNSPRPERSQELLESLGITHLKNSLPGDMSGGERQRAAIATALYHDPTVILADEPTAALDTHKALEVASILGEQTHKRNKATVMVTHDQRLLQFCDRVLIMEDGVLRAA